MRRLLWCTSARFELAISNCRACVCSVRTLIFMVWKLCVCVLLLRNYYYSNFLYVHRSCSIHSFSCSCCCCWFRRSLSGLAFVCTVYTYIFAMPYYAVCWMLCSVFAYTIFIARTNIKRSVCSLYSINDGRVEKMPFLALSCFLSPFILYSRVSCCFSLLSFDECARLQLLRALTLKRGGRYEYENIYLVLQKLSNHLTHNH